MDKIDKLIATHAAEIEAANKALATNFDIPARDIIAMACASMRISRKQWDAIQSRRIEAEA
jgi:hypothetical protein